MVPVSSGLFSGQFPRHAVEAELGAGAIVSKQGGGGVMIGVERGALLAVIVVS